MRRIGSGLLALMFAGTLSLAACTNDEDTLEDEMDEAQEEMHDEIDDHTLSLIHISEPTRPY